MSRREGHAGSPNSRMPGGNATDTSARPTNGVWSCASVSPMPTPPPDSATTSRRERPRGHPHNAGASVLERYLANLGRCRDLRHGEQLRTSDGYEVRVQAVRIFTPAQVMYNLTVDDIHTYYVLAGQQPVLVHNSSCPRFTVDSSGNVVELPTVKKIISQQNRDRHILNGRGYRGGGYFSSHSDAQAVLDAYRSGNAQIPGIAKGNTSRSG